MHRETSQDDLIYFNDLLKENPQDEYDEIQFRQEEVPHSTTTLHPTLQSPFSQQKSLTFSKSSKDLERMAVKPPPSNYLSSLAQPQIHRSASQVPPSFSKPPKPFSVTKEEILKHETVDVDRLKAELSTFGEFPSSEETIEVAIRLHEMITKRRKYIQDYFYPWETPTAVEYLKHTGEVEPLEHITYDESGNLLNPLLTFDPFDLKVPKFENEHSFVFSEGVCHVHFSNTPEKTDKSEFPYVSLSEFSDDFEELMAFVQTPVAKTFCFRRLKLLDLKFQLHTTIHHTEELEEQKGVPHRDFYNVRKVDTHVHLASSMNQKHLLRFIKTKLKQNGDDIVYIDQTGTKKMTLNEVFQSLNLNSHDLSVDMIDVHADANVFQRFDKFNQKYNPFGQSKLREIFLKTENYIQGKYFAELIMETFDYLKESKYQMSEPRVSIYGKKITEWTDLAKWVCNNRLYCDNVRWMIQIPRLYELNRRLKTVSNFQEMLKNIFLPLFEVTRDPSSNPELHCFLKHIGGFDQVDDESMPEKAFYRDIPTPDQFVSEENPPYAYYSYYLFTNIMVLNQYRKKMGLNTFLFRPHSGESGELNHLACTFLFTKGINHGIMLRKSPTLQYLYYLTQIGLAVSPLSNNLLFLNYNSNPFPEFFSRGLNVSLSTDDPLMFHFTREPLMEEYSVAAQLWRLSNTDLCEIARNSVQQSAWEHNFKLHWLGTNYWLSGPIGNKVSKTNVPQLRLLYRHETLVDEHLFILKCLHLGDYKDTPIPLSIDQVFEKVTRKRVLKEAEHMNFLKHLPGVSLGFRDTPTPSALGLVDNISRTSSSNLQQSSERNPTVLWHPSTYTGGLRQFDEIPTGISTPARPSSLDIPNLVTVPTINEKVPPYSNLKQQIIPSIPKVENALPTYYSFSNSIWLLAFIFFLGGVMATFLQQFLTSIGRR